MRGLFTAGVIDRMMEAGIVFDGAIGVSAGAVFGCNYKSNQPGRVLRYNLRFCKDPRYSSFRSLVTTGDLFGADFCYREIPDRLDPFDKQAYRENPMDFFVVGTDVHTGQPVYHNCLEGGRGGSGLVPGLGLHAPGRPHRVRRGLRPAGRGDRRLHPPGLPGGAGVRPERGDPHPAHGLCQDQEQGPSPDAEGVSGLPCPAGHPWPGGRTCTTRPRQPSGRRSAGARCLSSARRPPWTSSGWTTTGRGSRRCTTWGRRWRKSALTAMRTFLEERGNQP